MTLSFSLTHSIPSKAGEPTYFPEKIMSSIGLKSEGAECLTCNFKAHKMVFLERHNKPLCPKCNKKTDINTFIHDEISYAKFDIPKKHTFRTGERVYKPGDKLHLVIHNRTKKRYQFAPTLICTGVEKFEIKYFNFEESNPMVELYFEDVIFGRSPLKEINMNLGLQMVAQNDGFETAAHFFEWFDKPATGQCIHWTELNYKRITDQLKEI